MTFACSRTVFNARARGGSTRRGYLPCLGLNLEFSPAEFWDCLWSCLNPLTPGRALEGGTVTYRNLGFLPPRITPLLADVRSCMGDVQRLPVGPRIRYRDVDCPRCLCPTRCIALSCGVCGVPNFDCHEMALCRRLGWIAVITGPLPCSTITENGDSAVVYFSNVGVVDRDRGRSGRST